MKTLNLAHPDQSDIKYQISRFPDGQQNIVINPISLTGYLETEGSTKYWVAEKISTIQIKSRLNNWLDLEIIVASVASLRELGVKEIHLYVPYFLGARSDIKFEEGGNWYLKQVICPVINSLNFESVTVLDAHSGVLGNLLNNFKSIDNVGLVRFALNELYGPNTSDNFHLVSPDGGSLKKIYKVAEAIGFKDEIITCSKYRDIDGKLSKTYVPYRIDHYNKDMIIIDDICDGGRTFINIADEILKIHPDRPGKIYLIVTHGIFSAGFDELGKHFDGIFCTNSIHDLRKAISNNKGEKFVKQLNIF